MNFLFQLLPFFSIWRFHLRIELVNFALNLVGLLVFGYWLLLLLLQCLESKLARNSLGGYKLCLQWRC